MGVVEAKRCPPGPLAILAWALALALLGRAATLALGPAHSAAERRLAAEHGSAFAPRGRILDARGESLVTNGAGTRTVVEGAPAAVLGHPARRTASDARDEPATGLERTFDAELRASSDVTLTLDLALSREAASLLARDGISRATVVVLDPRDGGIRVALGANGGGAEAHDSDATRSRDYPPGGLVFPFLALEARARNASPPRPCDGARIRDGRAYACTHSHGSLDDAHAIEQGCSIHFFDVGDSIGARGVEDALGRSGLLEPGSLSTSETDLENAYLGQGKLRTSPLDVALAYAALANGGTVLTPRIRASEPARTRGQLPGREALASLLEGMVARARAMGGPPSVAATYAVGEMPSTPEGDEVPSARWFVGFAPTSAPRALVVLVSDAAARPAVNEAGFALVAAALEGARP